MTDAQPDTKALPMWLVSNQFAIHPMMAYSPGPPGTVPMPYFAGQSSVPGMGHSLPNTAGGKNKKRKRTDTISGNSGNDLNITNSHGVIKQEVPEDAAVKIEEEVVIKTEEAPVMNSALPTLRNTMPELITRLPAVMVRNTCRVCGKLFRSGQLLRQHMLVHTDQRKYQCRYCDRTFKQLSHLQQHHRIHTGEKPYKCELPGCNRSFPQLSNLQHHYRNHDKPDPPSDRTCVFCDRTYCSEVVLRNHVMKIHLANKSDPKLTQLGLDIKDLEKLDDHPNTSSIPANNTSHVVDLTIDSEEKVSDNVTQNFNNNYKREIEEKVGDFSESPTQKVRKNAAEKTQTHIHGKTGVSKPTSVSKTSSLSLIPLDRLTKVNKKLNSVANTSLPNIERLFSTNTEPRANLEHENESGLNNHSSKDKRVDDSNAGRAVCHRDTAASEQNMVSEEYTKSSTQGVMSNKYCSMYDRMMEEMSRKQGCSTDAGNGYNYVLDDTSETTEIGDSVCGITDSLEGNNIRDDGKTTFCHGVQLKQKSMKSCSSELTSQRNESSVISMKVVDDLSQTNCVTRYIADEETSVYTKVTCIENDKTVGNANGATSKPIGIVANDEPVLKEEETINRSSHIGPDPESVIVSSGRARKRKSFVPQRIFVPDFM